MALPFSFANNTTPNTGQLDFNFAAVGAMGNFSCTASGSNAIILTTTANQPAVTSYVNGQLFSFVAAASSTGSVTAAINLLAALPVYKPGGAQAGNGDIANGAPYTIMYLSTLNTGAGGFQIMSALPLAGTAVAAGSARGLTIANNVSVPNTSIDIAALQAVAVTTTGVPVFLSSPAMTIDLTTVGVNGMDVGTRPANGWVYLYIISNGSVAAGLASATSPTAGGPTMPGGYTYSVYIGAMVLSSSQLLRSKQKGRKAQYVVVGATNTAAYPTLGTSSGTSFTMLAISSFVPLTAGTIVVVAGCSTASTIAISPNNQTSALSPGVNPSALNTENNASPATLWGELVLESTNIYVVTNAGTLTAFCVGWTDYCSGG